MKKEIHDAFSLKTGMYVNDNCTECDYVYTRQYGNDRVLGFTLSPSEDVTPKLKVNESI